jgi:outer membrane protein TolC
MNKNYLLTIIFIIFFFPSFRAEAQETRKYTFDEIIRIAREQSPMAVLARHRFRSSYWEYRTYKAGLLPNLTLNSTILDLNRSIERITLPDGSDDFVDRKLINSSANLDLRQSIPFTGGNIFMSSDLQRIDILGDNGKTSYLSYPVSIGFNQPINGYNQYRWQKEIEPLKYREAEKNYIQALEDVSVRAVNNFFDLATAQKNIEITHINYGNADTLYQIAKGRYQLGTIAENELLQMELSYLNAGAALNEAQIDLEIKKFQLNSFLGLSQYENIELEIPNYIPEITINISDALEKAQMNNPEVLDRQQQLLIAEQSVDKAKSEKGVNASLYASFGLSKSAADFSDAYANPQDQERVRVGFEVPIADWGLGRGRYKMALSAEEVARVNVQQAEMDFQQTILLEVMQFNLQDDQLVIASKADTIANLRYEVSKQRFLIGKISVLDLNVAQSEKDVAARGYLNALRNYWRYYYNLRSKTLYDWQNDAPLLEDFDILLE